MGRLDDIVKRNQQKNLVGESVQSKLGDKIVDKLAGNEPAAPAGGYALPSQRKGFATWRVLVVLVILVAAGFGYYRWEMRAAKATFGDSR